MPGGGRAEGDAVEGDVVGLPARLVGYPLKVEAVGDDAPSRRGDPLAWLGGGESSCAIELHLSTPLR